MAIARAKGRLRGRSPKLSPKQQVELRRMHASGQYSISDLAEVFSISRRRSTAPHHSPRVLGTCAAVLVGRVGWLRWSPRWSWLASR
jgi:Helix-turn-helix domain of resolvase